jgi:hypothetical protein
MSLSTEINEMRTMMRARPIVRTVVLVALSLIAVPPAARAQDASAEVQAVIDRLFEGMRAGDTAAVRATFHEEMSLMSTGMNPEGDPIVGSSSADRFVGIVGQQPAGSLDERVGPSAIWMEDNLATVTMRFAFHYNGTLSHCGVNVFLIALTTDGWKIISIADTRRTDGCEGWLN